MYEVVISSSAAREIEKLAPDARERIFGVLRRANISPYRYARRLSGTDSYRIRAGKYRIIIDINERLNRIEVLTIGKRDSVYL